MWLDSNSGLGYMLSDNIEISPNIARKINNNMLKLIVKIHMKLKKKSRLYSINRQDILCYIYLWEFLTQNDCV